MKIVDLYELYKERVASSTENLKKEIYALFDEHIQLQDVSTDKILYLLRSLLVSCSSDDGDVRRLDYSYWEIGSYVAMIVLLTDIEFPQEEQEEESANNVEENEDLSTVYNYDMLKKMRVDEYIAKKHMEAYNRFALMKASEEKTFEKENGANVVFEKNLSYVVRKFGELLDKVVASIDKLDPSNIDDAQKLLTSMNEGVRKLSELNLYNNLKES